MQMENKIDLQLFHQEKFDGTKMPRQSSTAMAV
jgi:hypothetical protein